MAVCCQNQTLGALSSRSALSVLVRALFKTFGLFLNTPFMPYYFYSFKMPQAKVECRFCSYIVTSKLSVIFNLLANKGHYLMLATNFSCFLDFGLHVLSSVRGFYFQCDGFA